MHAEFASNPHLQLAVWALRVRYGGLATAFVGLIFMAVGPTPWLLAIGRRVHLGWLLWGSPRPWPASTRVLVKADHVDPSNGPESTRPTADRLAQGA